MVCFPCVISAEDEGLRRGRGRDPCFRGNPSGVPGGIPDMGLKLGVKRSLPPFFQRSGGGKVGLRIMNRGFDESCLSAFV